MAATQWIFYHTLHFTCVTGIAVVRGEELRNNASEKEVRLAEASKASYRPLLLYAFICKHVLEAVFSVEMTKR